MRAAPPRRAVTIGLTAAVSGVLWTLWAVADGTPSPVWRGIVFALMLGAVLVVFDVVRSLSARRAANRPPTWRDAPEDPEL